MTEILNILRDFSPMATVALALVVIFQLVMQRKSVDNLKTNHIHELVDALKRVEEKLDKISDNMIWVKSRLNDR